MTTVDLEFRGAARQFLTDKSPELGMVGSAGTGKTTGALYKLHLASLASPGCRSLLARREAVSLAATTLQSFNRFVIAEALATGLVVWYGGSAKEPAAYHYRNGSTIQVGGLDRPERIMSAEFDRILVDEGTDITERAYQLLLTRLRGTHASYRQMMLCCNPQGPTHWVKKRADSGKLTLLTSRHQDNPMYYDRAGNLTAAGAEYMARLNALTGVERLRLLDGIWAAAEGVIYKGYSAALHEVPAFRIPASWPRYWSVDFGFTHPFVLQCWAVDPDGRAYRYREIFHTQRLVEDHARKILSIVAPDGHWIEPKPRAIICDHDAEDRATLERHLKMTTTPARKSVSDGIQATEARWKPAGDGKPRLFYVKGALVERDTSLEQDGKPTCSEEEIGSYIWNPEKDAPVKEKDDGMDCTRYLVAHLDLQGRVRVRWSSR